MSETAPGVARRGSLAWRILAVNLLALVMLAGSVFYLDGFRARLLDERTAQAANEARFIATALAEAPLARQGPLLGELAGEDRLRLRLVDRAGTLIGDSWSFTGNGFAPNSEEGSWQRNAARKLDSLIDFIVRADIPPPFPGFAHKSAPRPGAVAISFAPDRTHMISASAQVGGARPAILLTDRNARDIRRIVRAERGLLAQMIGLALVTSILLSLFLARTIVVPLRHLSDAAFRVRTGRDREVEVPRLPERKDEIGLLAQSISDMTHTLRQRIDATESFAADVSHELKNPLASMASAVDSLRAVKRADLRVQLQDIIASDVRRLDRLISDISDLSRTDARLTRTRFELVELGALVATLIAARETRDPEAKPRFALARSPRKTTMIQGVPGQLERVIENLLDNAVSFSPPSGVVRVTVTRDGEDVALIVDDEGPGIADHLREAVFERFHSDRPEGEAFGQHSGLGLSIARTIVSGHGGEIEVAAATPGIKGARLIVRLPAAKPLIP